MYLNNFGASLVSMPNFPRGGGRGGGGGVRGKNWKGKGYNKGNKKNAKKNKHAAKKHEPIIPELIDSKKIFVYDLSSQIKEGDLKKFMSQFGNIVDITIKKQNFLKSRTYAFITVESEEDTERILSLPKEECKINGFSFGLKPGKLQFKVPGMPGFERTPLSDREFNLEPENPSEVSIHMLIDDVLLRIMDFLPLKDLLHIDLVCRRWQSLVHTSFRSKIPAIKEDNLNSWLSQNGIEIISMPAISKVLLLSGESLSSISIRDEFVFKGKLFRVIAQLCPSLEILNIDKLTKNSITTLKELAAVSPNLKSLKCTQGRVLNDQDLSFILMNLQNLENLHIESDLISGECFSKLPDTIQILELPRCRYIKSDNLNEIHNRCPLLKILRLDDTECSGYFMNQLMSNCPGITELALEGGSIFPELYKMKNLKKLSLKGLISYKINKLLEVIPEELEVLKLNGTILETENDLVDFSVAKNLRELHLPTFGRNSLSIQSIKSISLCSKLVHFKYKGTNNHKSAILEIIRRCQELKNLECHGLTLTDEDFDSFIEANKRRTDMLKMTIGLDQSAMNVIEKLAEANYDVNMFDVDNIFGDSFVFGDDDETFDVYDDLFSEPDYDSDNLFDIEDLDEEDLLYYENFNPPHFDGLLGLLDHHRAGGAFLCEDNDDDWYDWDEVY